MALQIKNNKGLNTIQGDTLENAYIYLAYTNYKGLLKVNIKVYSSKGHENTGKHPYLVEQIPANTSYTYVRPDAIDGLLFVCNKVMANIIALDIGITAEDIEVVDLDS